MHFTLETNGRGLLMLKMIQVGFDIKKIYSLWNLIQIVQNWL